MRPERTIFHQQQKEPPCPFCGTILNGIASDHGEMPSSGDFSVCLHCGEVLVFQVIRGEIGLRKPKPREAKEAGLNPFIRQARLNWLAVNRPPGHA